MVFIFYWTSGSLKSMCALRHTTISLFRICILLTLHSDPSFGRDKSVRWFSDNRLWSVNGRLTRLNHACELVSVFDLFSATFHTIYFQSGAFIFVHVIPFHYFIPRPTWFERVNFEVVIHAKRRILVNSLGFDWHLTIYVLCLVSGWINQPTIDWLDCDIFVAQHFANCHQLFGGRWRWFIIAFRVPRATRSFYQQRIVIAKSKNELWFRRID